MCKGLLGRKLGMTGVFTPEGIYVPVTILETGPCVVIQIKTEVSDGYNALQLGFLEKKRSRTNKPLQGHFKSAGSQCFSLLKEFPVEDPTAYNVGQVISVDQILAIGDRVNVTGTIKGRGFSGVVKRHGFSGGKDTHGCKSHKVPGSIGCSAWPAKVARGKKMPGHYGNSKKTVQNMEIVDIRSEENLILLKGAVPGWRSGWVALHKHTKESKQ